VTANDPMRDTAAEKVADLTILTREARIVFYDYIALKIIKVMFHASYNVEICLLCYYYYVTVVCKCKLYLQEIQSTY
jgi:hypothetical protein